MSSTPNFEIVKATIALIASNGDTTKVTELQTMFNNTVNDDFLRQVEAEIKRAQSTATVADIITQLDSLLKTSEARRNCILSARAARDAQSKTSIFDQGFSDKLNADIQYVAETTDQSTLSRALSSIATTRDLQSLQNAVRKLNQVQNDIHLQPSDASFLKKGLSSRDWTVKLQQIGTALQTRMNDLSKEQSLNRNAPLVVGDCSQIAQPSAPSANPAFDFFMRWLWLWIVLLVLLIVGIVLAAVFLRPKLTDREQNFQPTATS